MIIYHQDNVAAFAGAHTSYVVAQQLLLQMRISITSDVIDDLTANDTDSGMPTVGAPVVGQEHVLTANDTDSDTPTVGIPTVGQEHALISISEVIAGAPIVGTPTIAVIHNLAANNTDTDTPTVGMPVITQEHILAANNVDSGVPTVGAPTLGIVGVTPGGGLYRRRRR